MKRNVITISSSSSSSSDEEMSSQESEESDSSNGDSVTEILSSTCNEEDTDDDVDDENERKDEDSCCRRVLQLLREDSDIQVLTLVECKAYLRRNGLRLSGSRAECIQRIKEHWRLKDGNGEALYPRSTFSINCTGDVCKGDVVLFNQKVHKKFDKASRSGHLSGKRWVAGKVVKESYGARRQQHTFTVEVLWSKGVNKLPALYPLLIKGRNLYKMKTFRQRWKDENQRAKVVDEKHKRGDAARSIRETRWAKSAMRKQSASTNSKGQMCRKKNEYSQKVRAFVEGGLQAKESRNPAKKRKICKQKVMLPKTSDMNTTKEFNAQTSHSNPRYANTARPFEVRPSSTQPLAFPRHPTHFPSVQGHQNAPNFFPRYPTHIPLEQNHRNAPNFFSSSGSLSNSGFPDLHPPPAPVDVGFVNFDNRRYHTNPAQETGWRNSGSYYGPAAYPERRRYRPY